MRGLADKIALVTGAGSRDGIGFASALRLAEEGVRVVLTDVVRGEAAKRAEELCSFGCDAIGIDQDVTDEAQWDRIVAQAVERWGRLDIAVNNAGIAVLCPTVDMSLDTFNRQIDVNLTGVFLGCRAVMRQMISSGTGGSIINLSSIAAAISTGVGSGAYVASKAAVNMLTKTLALEGAAHGIRFNSVHPGVTDTHMIAEALNSDPDSIAAVTATIPAGRFARPAEIAAMIAFLASDDGSYCFGGSYYVDGGVLVQ